MVTTYGYDAGMLETTDYSDSTPDVTQTYDNFGRPVETSNGIAKTTYAYDAVTLVLNTETVFYDIDGDSTYELIRVIDRKLTTNSPNNSFPKHVGQFPRSPAIWRGKTTNTSGRAA